MFYQKSQQLFALVNPLWAELISYFVIFCLIGVDDALDLSKMRKLLTTTFHKVEQVHA